MNTEVARDQCKQHEADYGVIMVQLAAHDSAHCVVVTTQLMAIPDLEQFCNSGNLCNVGSLAPIVTRILLILECVRHMPTAQQGHRGSNAGFSNSNNI